jgi:hypothetical protein
MTPMQSFLLAQADMVRQILHNQQQMNQRRNDQQDEDPRVVLTVYFGTPSMFITLWFGFDYGTNPPLGTLII